MVTVRSMFAIAAAKGMIVEQLNVNNAFIHGTLHEVVIWNYHWAILIPLV